MSKILISVSLRLMKYLLPQATTHRGVPVSFHAFASFPVTVLTMRISPEALDSAKYRPSIVTKRLLKFASSWLGVPCLPDSTSHSTSFMSLAMLTTLSPPYETMGKLDSGELSHGPGTAFPELIS